LAFVFDPRDPQQFQLVLESFESSEPFALPTETVYGLAAPLFDEKALARVFELKARPTLDPLIAHVDGLVMAQELVNRPWLPLELKLMENFWPGPLTLVCPKSGVVPDLATAGTSFVAIRNPQHPVFRKVLEQWGGPLAAPSANRFGRISPTSSRDVCVELGPYGLRGVLEGGPCPLGLESTVVKVLDQNSLEIIRPGSLSLEDIVAVVGSQVEVSLRASGSGIQDSPGQLKSHYAPRKPLKFFSNQPPVSEGASQISWIIFSRIQVPPNLSGRVYVLSETGSLVEAAAKLFSTLRKADADSSREIWAREVPAGGLGLAINDRLRRAAGL